MLNFRLCIIIDMKKDFKPLYTVKADTEASGYYPFSVLAFVVVTGIVLLFTAVINKGLPGGLILVYFTTLVVTIVGEVVALYRVFPKEELEFGKAEDGAILFRYRFEEKEEIYRVKIAWWWWNHGALHILLTMTDNKEILLYDALNDLGDLPQTIYNTTSAGQYENRIRCFDLKDLTAFFQKAGYHNELER